MKLSEQIRQFVECPAMFGGDFNYLAGRIAELESKCNAGRGEWISVDERLPEPDVEYVLIYWAYGGMEIWSAYKLARLLDRRISHWMPLPEPPEDK